MGVSLSKGGNVSLTKEAPGTDGRQRRSRLGRTDHERARTSTSTRARCCSDTDGKILGDQYFIFFNNLNSPDGSVEHTGDNLTGEGEGDDEMIKVNVASVPQRSTRSS